MEMLCTRHAWDLLREIQSGQLHVADASRWLRQAGEAAIPELRRKLEAARVERVPTCKAEVNRYLSRSHGFWDCQQRTGPIPRGRLRSR